MCVLFSVDLVLFDLPALCVWLYALLIIHGCWFRAGARSMGNILAEIFRCDERKKTVG